jgi:hypothetical protein
MVAGYLVGKAVEYLVTTDWEDERRRSIDPDYNAVSGPTRSLKARRRN